MMRPYYSYLLVILVRSLWPKVQPYVWPEDAVKVSDNVALFPVKVSDNMALFQVREVIMWPYFESMSVIIWPYFLSR